MPMIPALWVDGSSSGGEVNGDETEGLAIVQIFPHLKKQKGFLGNRLSVRLFNKRKDWRGRKGKSLILFQGDCLHGSKIVFLSKVKPRKGPETAMINKHSFCRRGFSSFGSLSACGRVTDGITLMKQRADGIFWKRILLQSTHLPHMVIDAVSRLIVILKLYQFFG